MWRSVAREEISEEILSYCAVVLIALPACSTLGPVR